MPSLFTILTNLPCKFFLGGGDDGSKFCDSTAVLGDAEHEQVSVVDRDDVDLSVDLSVLLSLLPDCQGLSGISEDDEMMTTVSLIWMETKMAMAYQAGLLLLSKIASAMLMVLVVFGVTEDPLYHPLAALWFLARKNSTLKELLVLAVYHPLWAGT